MRLIDISSILLISPIKDSQANIAHGWSYWSRRIGDNTYVVHLRGLIPVSTVAGFVAGMIDIFGGIFKLPAMVLIGRVPMRIAIGTSSFMVAITAIAGLLGHINPHIHLDDNQYHNLDFEDFLQRVGSSVVSGCN